MRPDLHTSWGLEIYYRYPGTWKIFSTLKLFSRQVESGDLELCVGKLIEGGPASNVLQQGDIIMLEFYFVNLWKMY